MFIKSVSSGGGYRGDVNTAFRQGRQDAFRDYVDNFNFALRADSANNAENQRQVERVAKNYGLDLNMDQAARQNAYNFVKGSNDIDNAHVQAGIDFNRNSYLKDPTVQAELGKAKASEVVSNTQGGAVKAQNILNEYQFAQEQQPTTFQTKSNQNQAALQQSETQQVTSGLQHNGALDQHALYELARNTKPSEVVDFYIERHRALHPDSGLTDDQLRAEAMNNITDLSLEYVKQKGSQHVAGQVAAAGGVTPNGGSISFDPANKKGASIQPTKAQTKSQSTQDEQVQQPVTKSLGKVSSLSKDDFEKNIGNMVRIEGEDGVFRYGNAIVVQNDNGGYNVYHPNTIAVGKDNRYESEADLIARAKRASGRTGGSSQSNDPNVMR